MSKKKLIKVRTVIMLMLLQILIYSWGVYSITKGQICIGILQITASVMGFMIYIDVIRFILRQRRIDKALKAFAKEFNEKFEKKFKKEEE